MDAALEARFAAALLDPSLPPPEGLVTGQGGDPARRFAIYRNNVVASLVAALEARFPVTAALLGRDAFRATARALLAARPPRSPLLFTWGDELPGFLAGFSPVAALPYLPDLAALEAARSRAFHAVDAEPIGADALAALAPAALPGLRLLLHPSVELVVSRFAIVSLWSAHQEPDPAAVEAALRALDLARAEDALVWRSGEDVVVRALPRGAAGFFAALGAGEPLGAAARAALLSTAEFDLPAALALLLGGGLVVRLEQGEIPR